MCSRFRIKGSVTDFEQEFSFSSTEPLDPYFSRLEVRPTDPAPVILCESTIRKCEVMRWGLVPSTASSHPKGPGFINARAETLLEKPSFKPLIERPARRCAIFADGFYEWAKPEDPKQRKQPWLFRRPDDRPFAFAGLWDSWTDLEDGQTLTSCTLITTEPNKDVAPVHDRMPAILTEKDEIDTWLSLELHEDDLNALLNPLANGSLLATAIDLRTSDPTRPTLF